jgi:DNA repair exonuclease SbcCD nuclease subunit
VTAFRFLHAADIHLDSPLRGLSRYEGVPAERVRLATRDALENLVAAAIEEEVSFVVIAGDLYDGDWDDFGTGLYFCSAMGKLDRAGIPVYLLYGNHDADSVLTRKLPLPANVYRFGHRKPETHFHPGAKVALHGRSYADRDPGENLAAGYPAPVPGHFNIGVLHTSLAGGHPHAPYSPCTPEELAAKGYGYWALGHVHEHSVVSAAPHIVFSGNIQGRSVRECGPRGVVLVTVEDGHVVDTRHLAVDAVRWAMVEADISGARAEGDLHAALRAALRGAASSAGSGRPAMVRVVLTGRTGLHPQLVQRRTALREDVRAIAVSLSDQLWLEKVSLATDGPPAPGEMAGAGLDDLGALLELGLHDTELRDELAGELADFTGRVPLELGEEGDWLARAREGDIDPVLRDAATALRARLAMLAA